MNTNTSHFESKLTEEKETIINSLQKISINTKSKDKDDWEATPAPDEDSADSSDIADKISSYENNDAIVGDLEGKLRDIDYALNKIKDGSYGICEVCSQAIEEDRLHANPSARTCKTHLNETLSIPQL